MTDPIADLLTRIRNALMRGKATVNAPYSKVKHELSKLLVKEGFLTSVKKVKKDFDELEITLKYFNDCLLYTSPSPRDLSTSRMPSSA